MFNGFENELDVFKKYDVSEEDRKNVKIIFAEYICEEYEGNSQVLFMKDGQLYYVTGSHCSCYGLEDQWEPEETSFELIEQMIERNAVFYGSANKINELIKEIKELDFTTDEELQVHLILKY